nr:MAG TPA_asm: hypothetical protein [Caudoviricetes sp.]
MPKLSKGRQKHQFRTPERAAFGGNPNKHSIYDIPKKIKIFLKKRLTLYYRSGII